MSKTSITEIQKLVLEANTDASSDSRHYKLALERLKELMDEDIMNVLSVIRAIGEAISGCVSLTLDVHKHIHPCDENHFNNLMSQQFERMSEREKERFVITLEKYLGVIVRRFNYKEWERLG